MKRLLFGMGVLLISLIGMCSCTQPALAPIPTPAKEVDTINKAYEAVYLHLDGLATTSHAKEFLADLSDTITNVDCSVLTAEGEEKEVNFDNELSQDFNYFIVRRWYSCDEDYPEQPPIGNSVVGGVSFDKSQWHDWWVICFTWLVDPADGTVRPFNGNAYRVEAELAK